MMRLVLPTLLILEGMLAALRIANLLPTIMVYDAVALILIALRGGVGALAFVSGWLLRIKRPPGETLAQAALLSSAVLTTLEIGARLAPSNLDPAYRWPF